MLSEVDAKGKPLPPKPDLKKNPWANLWMPKTRMVLGVVFLAVLIYDMVSVARAPTLETLN